GRVMYHGVRTRGAGCDVRDVAIVGAGPAGARAAYVLARRGARVTIFDGSHPREKPCGGGVTGRALALVADAVDPAAFPRTDIRSARFTHRRASGATAGTPDVTEAVVPLEGGALVVASRRSFDAALLTAARQAGASLVPSRVADLAMSPSGATLTTADGR